MQMIEPCFTRFKSSIDSYSLPERFTFPFYYQPHPLCLLAAQELQDTLVQLPASLFDYSQSGKMFGVLLVENKLGELGYLSGFSGMMTQSEALRHFVPLVDDSTNAEFFKKEQRVINDLNAELILLEANPDLAIKKQILAELLSAAKQATSQLHSKNLCQRQARKVRRDLAEKSLVDDEFILLKEQLAKESVADKNELKYWEEIWNKP